MACAGAQAYQGHSWPVNVPQRGPAFSVLSAGRPPVRMAHIPAGAVGGAWWRC